MKPKRLKHFVSRKVEIDLAYLRRRLMRGALSTREIADYVKCSLGQAVDALEALRESGTMLDRAGEVWSIARAPAMQEKPPLRLSDASGWHRFGVISDTHYGSRYCREDVCEDIYDWYRKDGISTVYHCGNWIDGEASFNRYDLIPEAHGMQAQLDYFVARYPRRKGMVTSYVAGDDHEGWYFQREGVDIGRMLSDTALRAGRTDLDYLGYKEAFVTLEHRKSGKHTRLLVDHPGSGSAYADSYAAQKRVEAIQPGEKPGMWLFGHWHKAGYFWPRGVHVILAGCTKDLDPFGRKKGLRYDIGGWIIEAKQDAGGAIVEVVPRFRAYYDRAYHNAQYGLDRKVRR